MGKRGMEKNSAHTRNWRSGASLIDVAISLGIVGLLFTAIFLVYFSIIDATSNISARAAASRALAEQVETIRNLSFESVGVAGGAPTGVLPATKNVAVGNFDFVIAYTVRNIDDPFDGTIGGAPNDTSPADYKLVELRVTCPACPRFSPLTFTTTVAPKNLESASSTGSLFVNVFNAAGAPLAGASVHVVNASTTPTIDLTDTTNNNGVLQLVGIPTSTQSYQIDVSKSGYSSDKTYPSGAPANPNPLKSHATVAASTLTSISFAIDTTAQLTVRSSDTRCNTLSNKNFSFQGAKLIGTSPDVLKFSTSSTTGGTGAVSFTGLEWDTYTFSLTAASTDLLGTVPLSPLVVNPGSLNEFRFVTQSSDPNSIMVTAVDAGSGAGIQGATVTLSKSGFSKTLITGRSAVAHSDWSGGSYSSKDAGIDVDGTPGSIKLAPNASSTYSTTTVSSLVSNTIDVGSSTATYYTLSWNPASQPPSTGAGSAKFQVAANNDQATWNFVGPDGTAATYYTASSTLTGFNNNRYVRYKAYLSTADETTTPSIDDVTIEFYSVCVPSAQVYFGGLSADTYNISVSAPFYNLATSSVSVGSGWQEATVQLTPL
jgi:hypothetical protein